MPKTILVVDDDRETLEVVQAFLEEKGYHVITSDDGKNCFREIVLRKPDLLILDINMPGMDGMRVVDMVKVTQISPRVPIMIYSGEADRETIEKAERLGIDDFVVKPTPAEEMARRIETVLFTLDFNGVQDVVRGIVNQQPDTEGMAGLNSADYADWDLYPTASNGMELCVFLSKGLPPQEAVELDEDIARDRVAVYLKLRSRWKRLWVPE